MARLAVGLVVVGLLLGCEETPAEPVVSADPSLSASFVGPVRYVAIDALPPAIGLPYLRQFSAVGGRPPYRWSVQNGAVAAGLTLSESGLLTGTTRDPASYAYSVRVTDAVGMMEEFGVEGMPSRGRNVPFTLGAMALGGVVLGGETGYQPFFQGGTPPFRFTASGLPPGLAIDSATGMISGSASRSGVYTVSIGLTDAQGAVPEGSPAVGSLLVVRPGQGGATSSRRSKYGGVWTGIFSLQYQMCPEGYGKPTVGSGCDRFVGAGLPRQTANTERGVLAVKAVMTVEEITSPLVGVVVLAVKKISLSHPAFGCVKECELDPGSVLVLEPSSRSTPATNGVGLVVVGPKRSFTLTTASATSSVEMRLGGTTLGNSQDPSIRTNSWSARIDDQAFAAVALPRLLTQPEARVIQVSWVVSQGVF